MSVIILCYQFVFVATWLAQILGKLTVVARWEGIVDVLIVAKRNAHERMQVVVVTKQSEGEKL